MSFSLASRTSSCAPSRTCVTEPAAPGASGSCTAWIESIASTTGSTVATEATTAGSDVSETTNSSGASTPSRSARIRTWAVDSSAHTSRQRSTAPRCAPSACMSSVLLPMPGSPPTSVTDPATSPPPSTRSSSATSVAEQATPAARPRRSASGTLRSAAGRSAARRPDDGRATGADSATEPHVPHSVQRPSHFGDCAPQVEHSKTAERTDVRVMG